jgi:ubiquinone/menaquinone biosynthesis C-methylase UbiE
MPAVAHSTSSGTNPEIEWREGSAIDMPLEAETFDVVFCQ